jgi:hypothetical protein
VLFPIAGIDREWIMAGAGVSGGPMSAHLIEIRRSAREPGHPSGWLVLVDGNSTVVADLFGAIRVAQRMADSIAKHDGTTVTVLLNDGKHQNMIDAVGGHQVRLRPVARVG